ncbi:putative cbiG [Burkholderia oklahomensis]|uniref:CbiG n=1 Tax=Burkholderia oklahomensis TaxID=342113 RepID=A0AAI8B5M7_9BURK|nr:putative cbiG [Burkholderia oklahomensis]AJX33040.1 putative cbiG [Burkholderia oklahomensis C6786]
MPAGMRRSRRRIACAMHSLTVAGAAQVGGPRRGDAPCFPFNCVRQNPHASTKTRASVGARARRVKADKRRRGRGAAAGMSRDRRPTVRPAADVDRCGAGDLRRIERHRAADASNRDCPPRRAPSACRPRAVGAVLSYARVRCPSARSRAQSNGKQEAASPRSLCCPRNGTPPATRTPRSRIPPSRHCPRHGREGGGMASGQPGYRPTQGASRARRTPDPAGDGTGRATHGAPAPEPAADCRDHMIPSDSRRRNPRARASRAAAR